MSRYFKPRQIVKRGQDLMRLNKLHYASLNIRAAVIEMRSVPPRGSGWVIVVLKL